MKILATSILLLLSTSTTFAQTTPTTDAAQVHPKEAPTKKKAEKNVKTNGEISTAGCETASGKTLAENDFGYADCVKQIGLKKKQ